MLVILRHSSETEFLLCFSFTCSIVTGASHIEFYYDVWGRGQGGGGGGVLAMMFLNGNIDNYLINHTQKTTNQ